MAVRGQTEVRRFTGASLDRLNKAHSAITAMNREDDRTSFMTPEQRTLFGNVATVLASMIQEKVKV